MSPAARDVSRLAIAVAIGGSLLASGGCAFFTCEPITVTVARKQEYGRLETPFRGYQTTPSGGLEPITEPTLAWQYWVQAEGGPWYRVSAEEYRTAEPGQPIRVCP